MIKIFVSTACQKTIMSMAVSQSLHVVTSHLVKKHRTLLHEDKKLMPNSPANSSNVNAVQAPSQQNSINTDENPEIPLVVNKIKSMSSENSRLFTSSAC